MSTIVYRVSGKNVITPNYPGASLFTGLAAPGRITINQMYVHLNDIA